MDAVNPTPDTARLIPSVYRLRMPGPTMVPERVRQAMALPVISHRGPEFRRILGDVTQMMRNVIGTQDDIFFLGTSGTGGMEAALANVLSPGDAVLVVVCGQFGERFVSIAQGMNVAVDQAAVPWGEAPDAALVAGHLKHRKYRAVVCVHNESSTGVVTDIAAIGKLLSGTDTLLIVDSVSGLGGIDMRMDDWGVDILIAASQKALMCPPGLAVIAVSLKAMAVIESASAIPRFYFDLRRAKASAKNNESSVTPPISVRIPRRARRSMPTVVRPRNETPTAMAAAMEPVHAMNVFPIYVSRVLGLDPLVANLILLLVPLSLGAALLLRANRAVGIAALVFLFFVWWIGQDFGMLSTFPNGTGTDPNTAPGLASFLVPLLFRHGATLQ